MSDETLVKVENVSFSYDSEVVVENINLEIKKGEFLGLIGPNGSGKSTLLKIILGLLKPQKGNVYLFGSSMDSFNQFSKIGYVPQRSSINVHIPITVEEVVGMSGTKNIDEALTNVNMKEYKKRLITELSGGQQQRVFIARALATHPELLVLDEPTIGVDSESQEKFYELLKDLNHKHGLTLILVSHDIDVVTHEVGTVACINRTLISHGKPKDILNSEFMKKLYGKNVKFVVHGH